MSKKYEIMYILSPTLEEEENQALHTRVQDLIAANGTADSVDHWGRKRFAYEIDDQTEGDYCVVLFTAEPEVPAILENQLKITEGVMRFMIVNVEEE